MPRRAFVGISVIGFVLVACGGAQQSAPAGGSGAASPGGVPEGQCDPVAEPAEAGTGGTLRVGIGGSTAP